MTTETKSPYLTFVRGLESITNNDAFNKATSKVFEDAFVAIFEAQDAGKLQWKRTGEDLRDFTAEAVVKNARGEELTVPIFLFTGFDENAIRGIYLTLVERGGNAPCRNDMDSRVQKLFTQLTGKSWGADPIGDQIRSEHLQSLKQPRKKFLGIF